MNQMATKTSGFQRITSQLTVPDWIAALVLLLLAIWLIRGHVLGDSLWIGNPDRLNSDLKILKHYLSGLSSGHIAAWIASCSSICSPRTTP